MHRTRSQLLLAILGFAAFLLAAVDAQTTGGPLFLLIDEDSIDNGNPPNFFSDFHVNDDIAAVGVRAQLRFFRENVGRTITLRSGQIGDEGWFALKTIPGSWGAAGGLSAYVGNAGARPGDPLPHGVGPGLGAPDSRGDWEALLDNVPDVTPLRAGGLELLREREVCALVYDSDISINYSPLNGQLRGATLGLVAFRVARVTSLEEASSALPAVEITILDAARVCASSLALFTEAPTPLSSSDPVTVGSNAVVNAASFAPAGSPGHPSSPGSIVSIFGRNLTSETLAARSVPLPASLGGVSVTFNGVPARLFFVSPGQINAQLPWGVLPAQSAFGVADIVVTREGVSSSARAVQLSRFSPGIFTFQSGIGPAVALHPDGTLAQPAGLIRGVPSRPARTGETIIVLVTGLGPVDSSIEAGHNSLDRIRRTTSLPIVLIGGREADVLFSGLSPEFVGVYQVNVEAPSGVPVGDAVPLQIRMGGITTSDQVTIAVRP